MSEEMKYSPGPFHVASPGVGCSALRWPFSQSEKRLSYKSESFVSAQSFISDWGINTLDPK